MWHILLDHLIHFPLFDKNFRCFAIASSVTYPYSEIRQTILCQCTMWYATTLENPYQCSRFRFYIFIIYWGFFHRWKYCKYTLRLQDDTVTLNGRKPVLLLGYYWGDQGCRWRKCTLYSRENVNARKGQGMAHCKHGFRHFIRSFFRPSAIGSI